MTDETPQQKGGRARSAKLSPEDRKRIAQAAAEAKWAAINEASEHPILEATHFGEIRIGDMELPCAVLADGTRLLTERGCRPLLAEREAGRIGKRNESMAPLCLFISRQATYCHLFPTT